MRKITTSDVLELSITERIELVEDIWDSIAAVPDSTRLTDAQREELDRRLASYIRIPKPDRPGKL